VCCIIHVYYTISFLLIKSVQLQPVYLLVLYVHCPGDKGVCQEKAQRQPRGPSTAASGTTMRQRRRASCIKQRDSWKRERLRPTLRSTGGPVAPQGKRTVPAWPRRSRILLIMKKMAGPWTPTQPYRGGRYSRSGGKRKIST
jgi:hypothetical protein